MGAENMFLGKLFWGGTGALDRLFLTASELLLVRFGRWLFLESMVPPGTSRLHFDAGICGFGALSNKHIYTHDQAASLRSASDWPNYFRARRKCGCHGVTSPWVPSALCLASATRGRAHDARGSRSCSTGPHMSRYETN